MKNITITKREPHKCVICGNTDVEYWIYYCDPAKPGNGPSTGKFLNIVWPTATLQSCAKCLEVALYKMMNEQNLLSDKHEERKEG